MTDKGQIRREDFESFTAYHDAAIEAGMSPDEIFKLESERLKKFEKKHDTYMASPKRKAMLERLERLEKLIDEADASS